MTWKSNKWWTCWKAFSHFPGFTWESHAALYMNVYVWKVLNLSSYREKQRCECYKMKRGRRWNRIENEVEVAGLCRCVWFLGLIKRCSSFTLSFGAALISHDSLELSAAPSAGCSWAAAQTAPFNSHIICSVSLKAANHSSKHKSKMHYALCLPLWCTAADWVYTKRKTDRKREIGKIQMMFWEHEGVGPTLLQYVLNVYVHAHKKVI